jgi:hypothetical protein
VQYENKKFRNPGQLVKVSLQICCKQLAEMSLLVQFLIPVVALFLLPVSSVTRCDRLMAVI